MAYETTNPPVCIVPRVGTHAAVWVYQDADAHGTVSTGNYFSNGDDLGMVAGDVMIVIDTNTPTCTIHHVATALSITAATLA